MSLHQVLHSKDLEPKAKGRIILSFATYAALSKFDFCNRFRGNSPISAQKAEEILCEDLRDLEYNQEEDGDEYLFDLKTGLFLDEM